MSPIFKSTPWSLKCCREIEKEAPWSQNVTDIIKSRNLDFGLENYPYILKSEHENMIEKIVTNLDLRKINLSKTLLTKKPKPFI